MAKAIVLVAGKDPLTATGGHSSYVRAHGMAAMRMGFEPHVFCVGDPRAVEATEFGIVHRVASPMRPVRSVTVALHAPFLTAAVARFLQTQSAPHLVHGFSSWAYVGGVVRRRMSRRAAKVIAIASAYSTIAHETAAKLGGIISAHGLAGRVRLGVEYLWTRAVANRIERAAYEESQLVLVNYESVRRLLEVSFDMRAEIRRLPYAAPSALDERTRSFEPSQAESAEPPSPPLIVSVSRHDPRKGVDILLHALAGLQRNGVAFRACLIGPGALLSAHRRIARELGVAGEVEIPGEVEDPLAYLRNAEVFVLPSLEEGSGSVSLLEAMQAATAVVASDCDGIPEDLTHGDNALLVPRGDPAALRDALACLIADAPLRRRLARRARETYEQKFSAAPFIAALREVYAELGVVP